MEAKGINFAYLIKFSIGVKPAPRILYLLGKEMSVEVQHISPLDAEAYARNGLPTSWATAFEAHNNKCNFCTAVITVSLRNLAVRAEIGEGMDIVEALYPQFTRELSALQGLVDRDSDSTVGELSLLWQKLEVDNHKQSRLDQRTAFSPRSFSALVAITEVISEPDALSECASNSLVKMADGQVGHWSHHLSILGDLAELYQSDLRIDEDVVRERLIADICILGERGPNSFKASEGNLATEMKGAADRAGRSNTEAVSLREARALVNNFLSFIDRIAEREGVNGSSKHTSRRSEPSIDNKSLYELKDSISFIVASNQCACFAIAQQIYGLATSLQKAVGQHAYQDLFLASSSSDGFENAILQIACGLRDFINEKSTIDWLTIDAYQN